VAQIALALILLAGAGLMMRSFLRLQQVRLGFNPDNVLTLRVNTPGSDYRGSVSPFYHQLVERVNALPGVEVAGAIIPLPLSGVDESWDNRLTVEGQSALPFGQSPRINLGIITPQYFRTMEIPLLAGRAFKDADTRDTPRVAIIDERLAREYWPNESPLGKRIRIGLPGKGDDWRSVVGVVGTVQHERLDAATRKMVYVPSLQDPTGFQTLVVRSLAPRESLIAAVRNVGKEMDPNLPITHVAMMREVIAESIWQPRMNRGGGSLRHPVRRLRCRGVDACGGWHLRRDVIYGRRANTRDRHPHGAGRRAPPHAETGRRAGHGPGPWRRWDRGGRRIAADTVDEDAPFRRQRDRSADLRRRFALVVWRFAARLLPARPQSDAGGPVGCAAARLKLVNRSALEKNMFKDLRSLLMAAAVLIGSAA